MHPLPGATVGQFRRARAGRLARSPPDSGIRGELVTRRSNFAVGNNRRFGASRWASAEPSDLCWDWGAADRRSGGAFGTQTARAAALRLLPTGVCSETRLPGGGQHYLSASPCESIRFLKRGSFSPGAVTAHHGEA